MRRPPSPAIGRELAAAGAPRLARAGVRPRTPWQHCKPAASDRNTADMSSRPRLASRATPDPDLREGAGDAVGREGVGAVREVGPEVRQARASAGRPVHGQAHDMYPNGSREQFSGTLPRLFEATAALDHAGGRRRSSLVLGVKHRPESIARIAESVRASARRAEWLERVNPACGEHVLWRVPYRGGYDRTV